MESKESLEKAKEILLGAKTLVVLTGAGISAESGIPNREVHNSC